MPNYCDNFLSINGKQKDIVKFLNDFIDTSDNKVTFSMSKIVPEPASPNEDKSYDWYSWRLENWGCKWDIDLNTTVEEIYDNIIEITDVNEYCSISIPYTTPWGPNIKFLEIVSKLYPISFNLKYYEPGSILAGDITFEDGNADSHYQNQGDYDFEYFKWAIENDFEDVVYILDEMNLEEHHKEVYDKLNNYYRPIEDNVLDLSDTLLGNNLPKPE